MTPRTTFSVLLIVGLVVAFGLAFFLSPFASSQPDGLNKVAIDQGFSANEQPHAGENLPTAGYGVRGIESESLSTGLAGIIGVAVTFGLGIGLFMLVRRTGESRSPSEPGRS